MPWPSTTLDDIQGFAGGSLGDQLRRPRRVLPPPPPDGRPRIAEPRTSPLGPDLVNPESDPQAIDLSGVRPRTVSPLPGPPTAETIGPPPTLRPVPAMGDAPPPTSLAAQLPPPPNFQLPDLQPQSPTDPPPDQLNSVGRELVYGQHRRFGQPHVGPDGKQIGTYGTGEQEHLKALMAADPTSPVRSTPAGWEVGPVEKQSRLKQALMGVLYGALEGGKVAGARGALGGAATGGIGGAVSPKLIKAMTREQEIDYSQGKVDRELSNQAKQGQIGVQQSQIEENRAQAERARRGTPHYQIDRDGNLKAIYDTGAMDVRDVETGEPVLGRDPDAETEHERNMRSDAMTRHRERLAQQKAKDEAAEKRKVDVTVGGKKYRVNPDTAARIAQQQRAAANKPTKSQESAVRAVIEEEAEENALSRRKETDEQISALLADKAKLHPDKYSTQGKRDAERSDEIDRTITDLRRESDNQQRIAETAAQNKRAAEAEARAGGQVPKWKRRGAGGSSKPAAGKPGAGKAFNLKAWADDHPGADINAKRSQLIEQGYTIN